MANESGKRTYRKRRRAELEDETRRRITEAAVKLHGTIGPAKTTVSGIAREAGVQRATVYRHFPDEESIYAACTAHYNGLHPPPDPEPWTKVADPTERLRLALGEIYGFYDETEQMIESTGRDADRVPAVRRAVEAMASYLDASRAILMRGRPERGRARARASAAIGHSLAFTTWRSLCRDEGIDQDEAVGLMLALIASASA